MVYRTKPYGFSFLIAALLLLVASCAHTQVSSFNQAHNLDFRADSNKRIAGWNKSYFSAMATTLDSSINLNGKYPVKIFQLNLFKGLLEIPLNAKLQQRIALPPFQADSAMLQLGCKGQNLKAARLVVSGIDGNENLLYSDTLNALGGNKWEIFSISVPLKNTRFLHLMLEAQGLKDSTEQNWWLDKLRILVNNKVVEKLAFTGQHIETIKNSEIVPLSFSDSRHYANIPELESAKVLAIGESVHGSATIAKAAIQLIKHRVVNNNCRLILLEKPLLRTLSFNRYIQADEAFSLDSLMKDYRSLYSQRDFKDLLLWLKAYNQTAKEKVWLMGMDIDTRSMNSGMWLFDYFYAIMQKKYNRTLDSICAELAKNDESYPKLLKMIRSNPELKKPLGEKEYKLLQYGVQMIHNINIQTRSRVPIRDSMMFENSKLLMALFCPRGEKTTVYAHLGHVNYKTISPHAFDRSYGSYMKNLLGDDYLALGVLAEKGKVLVGFGDSVAVKPLQAPPNYSIEHLLGQSNEGFLYVPSKKLPVSIAYAREMGAGYRDEQFGIIAPASRMSGLIFVKDSEPSTLAPEKMTSVYNRTFVIYKYRRNLYKYRRWQKAQKEGVLRPR